MPEHQVRLVVDFCVFADHDPAVAGIFPRIPRPHTRPLPSVVNLISYMNRVNQVGRSLLYENVDVSYRVSQF